MEYQSKRRIKKKKNNKATTTSPPPIPYKAPHPSSFLHRTHHAQNVELVLHSRRESVIFLTELILLSLIDISLFSTTRDSLLVAIATTIVLLTYYLSQHSVDTELPFFDLPPPQRSEADKVIRLPDQPQVYFQQYANYITVDEVNQRNLFYYFVEFEVDHVSKPVVLWLSGGPDPGCSSIGQGAFTKHGPFQPTRKGGLVINSYSWNRVANMLYLESAVGVGFSYSANTSDYIMVTDERTSRDAIVFLQGWFTRFQKYKNSDVFITGVSYHWAPQIVELILQTKPSFNLKGIAMGKSLLDFTTYYNFRAEFLWGHRLIFAETYGMLRTVCNYAQIMRENINGTLSITYQRLTNFNGHIGRFVDAFNIIEDICLPSEFELVNEIPMVCTHPQEGS
ncbi:serine carboxypeptidase [Trifolium repens]|nr:serine carboxypeptidase [Trifolium repens]